MVFATDSLVWPSNRAQTADSRRCRTAPSAPPRRSPDSARRTSARPAPRASSRPHTAPPPYGGPPPAWVPARAARRTARTAFRPLRRCPCCRRPSVRRRADPAAAQAFAFFMCVTSFAYIIQESRGVVKHRVNVVILQGRSLKAGGCVRAESVSLVNYLHRCSRRGEQCSLTKRKSLILSFVPHKKGCSL